jgi:hypothetical protein
MKVLVLIILLYSSGLHSQEISFPKSYISFSAGASVHLESIYVLGPMYGLDFHAHPFELVVYFNPRWAIVSRTTFTNLSISQKEMDKTYKRVVSDTLNWEIAGSTTGRNISQHVGVLYSIPMEKVSIDLVLSGGVCNFKVPGYLIFGESQTYPGLYRKVFRFETYYETHFTSSAYIQARWFESKYKPLIKSGFSMIKEEIFFEFLVGFSINLTALQN